MSQKNVYEIGMLINPDLSQQEAEGTVQKVKEILSQNGASVLSEGEIVNIELAYQIVTKIASKNERFNEAHFVWVKFEAEPGMISEIKRGVDKIKKEVFRYLITKTVADDELTDKLNLATDVESEFVDDEEDIEEKYAEFDESDDLDKVIEENKAKEVVSEDETEEVEETEEEKLEEKNN